MPSEDQNRQPSYPKTLGQILEAFPFAQNSDLTSDPEQPNLSTTGKAVAKHAPTGNPPSETVLDNLRNIALSINKGQLLDNQTLQTLLEQHFGSRLAIKKKREHVYGKNGYDCIERGFGILLDHLSDDEMKIFDAIDFFNKPSDPVKVAGCLTRMRVSMIRRNESDEDIEILIDTLTDLGRKYPYDIVNHVTKYWLAEKKFFPIPSEFIAECEKLVEFRRAVQKCFEKTGSPFKKIA